MSSIIIAKVGESIWDICLNNTGGLENNNGPLSNLDAILEANGFTSWTETLFPGQAIVIPDTVTLDQNTLRQLKAYPVCNNANIDVDAEIRTIFDILANNWILETGFWNGDGIWTADGLWNPAP